MKCPACGARVSRRAASCSACGQDLATHVAALRARKSLDFEEKVARIQESRAELERRLVYWEILALFYGGGTILIILITATLQNGLALLLFIVLVFLGWLVRLKLVEELE